jgi:hypothetical protein
MLVVARQFRVDAPQPCGRGWVGVKGNCKRKPKGGGGDARLAQERAGLGRLGKGSSTRQAKIDKLRAKLENKSSKLQKAATAERMKKGKTEKYRDLERQIDRRAGVLENRSVIAKVRAGQEKRSAARAEKLQQEMDAMWAKEAQKKKKKEEAATTVKEGLKAKTQAPTKTKAEPKPKGQEKVAKDDAPKPGNRTYKFGDMYEGRPELKGKSKQELTAMIKKLRPEVHVPASATKAGLITRLSTLERVETSLGNERARDGKAYGSTSPKAESKNNATKRVNSKRKQYQEMFS